MTKKPTSVLVKWCQVWLWTFEGRMVNLHPPIHIDPRSTQSIAKAGLGKPGRWLAAWQCCVEASDKIYCSRGCGVRMKRTIWTIKEVKMLPDHNTTFLLIAVHFANARKLVSCKANVNCASHCNDVCKPQNIRTSRIHSMEPEIVTSSPMIQGAPFYERLPVLRPGLYAAAVARGGDVYECW